jgi:Bacterial alpha-L-rhamnosidase 6 hairpin glycosidase domain/Bacterial alpha-L-rhamnosidase C-terminal domain/Alpha-L-rhamnosidase N-terminal domain
MYAMVNRVDGARVNVSRLRRRLATGAVAVAAAVAAVTLTAPAALARPSGFAPSGLNVGDRTDPLDVTGAPQFGWLPHAPGGDQRQTAYELRVLASPGGQLVWDSGRVASSDEAYVPYAGPALKDGTSYTWTVRTWDDHGQASPWAQPAGFDTGINDNEWSGAQWIRRVTTGNDLKVDYTLARRQFTLTDPGSPVVRARVYLAAEGVWQLHVNGQTIDTQYDYQAPGETYYDVENITRQARAAQQAPGAASDRLAVGVKYASWATTEGEPRMEGPVAASTTLSAAAPAGATAVTVASPTIAGDYAPGENVAIGAPGSATFEVDTVKAISGSTVTLTGGLRFAHAAAEPVVSENGPSGLLVKVVVDHADGTQETFVSDGSWLVTKDTSELNDSPKLRSTQNAGAYIERYDAQQEITGWDTAGFTPGSAWVPATVMGTHPLVNPGSCANYLSGGSPCGFTHLLPMESALSYRMVHPVSVKKPADGTIEADFGTALYGVPVVHFADGVAGNTVDIDGSYRLDHSTLADAVAAGSDTITVAGLTTFPVSVGDTVTVDAPADGYGAGHPEQRTVTAINGTTLTLNAPLSSDHAAGVWVQGSRVGTQPLDNQTTNLNSYYTETGGPQTTNFFVGEGFRYLEITGAGENLSPSQIWVVASAEDAPVGSGVYAPGASGAAPDRQATFTSSNPTLNAVFGLFQRSALYSGEEEFNDSPDRQDGQFLGDAVDESFATMESLDERALTREAIQNFILSQKRYWLSPGAQFGDMNAVYPDGDGKRDIPDYTEMFPEWVMRYYELTGDQTTLASAYQTMQNVAAYVTASIPTSGPFDGLVYDLAGGSSSSYRYGILDWPADMRYDMQFLGASPGGAAEALVNDRAVEVYRALAEAATALGQTADAAKYTASMNSLISAINSKLIDANGLYDDGLKATDSSATSAQLTGSTSEHAQSFAIDYGVAPASKYQQLDRYIASQGMKQGPMDLGQLEQALVDAGDPTALVGLLTNAGDDGPAKILAEGGTSMWEEWDPGCATAGCTGSAVSQTSSESFSHGWGSVGIYSMLRGLLGITPTGAGAATVTIAPPASGLDRARGSEWTERGPVTVSWQHEAQGVGLVVDVPDNVTARIELPAATAAQRYAAGGPGGAGGVRFIGVENGQAVYLVGSGRWQFQPARR